VPGLSRKIREKLPQVRPQSLGQAVLISGVTPAALAVPRLYLKRAGALKGQESESGFLGTNFWVWILA